MEYLYSELNLNSSDSDPFEFEPNPIQSYSKLDQVNRFQRQENAREQNRKNDPPSEKILGVFIVIVFIVLLLILLLVYIKVCNKYYKSPTTSGNYTLKGGRWMLVPESARGEGGAEDGTGLFIPTQMELPPMRMKSGSCSKPACVCAVGGNKRQKTKGWTRNSNDIECYGPSNKV